MTKPSTIAMQDRLVALLIDQGPLTTPEIRQALRDDDSARNRYESYCLTRWTDAYRYLMQLHSRGLVNRAKAEGSGPIIWSASREAVRQREAIDAQLPPVVVADDR